MYTGLLHAHKGIFYLVSVLLIVAVVKFILGAAGNKPFSKLDNKLSLFSLIGVHIQLLLGLVLYFISPVVKSGLSDVGAAMKDDNLRFWTVEHISIMIVGIILITVGRSLGKKATTDKAKFAKHRNFFIAGIIFIFSRVPWDRVF
jgi:H+/Cl- antiporter ClcA